jgi:transcriptional regulator with XRE-family HTH domain
MDIGSFIKRARLSEGLSQSELAHKVGVSQALVSHWENGRFKPDSSQQRQIERVLGELPKKEDSEGQSLSTGAFAAWLSSARRKAGLSVPELAKSSGISAVAIYNLEAGRSSNPQKETKSRLEGALNTEVPKDVQKVAAEEQVIEGIGTLTDFDPHDEDALPSVPGVYVFYDVSERPIYIGKSDNIGKRVRSHFDKFWFKRPIVNTASFVEIKNSGMRHSVEQVLIKFLKSNAVINKQSVDR